MFKRKSEKMVLAETPLADGERVREVFLPAPAVYWRNTIILAILGAVILGAALWAFGSRYLWIGPLVAVLAIGGRGFMMRGKVLGGRWRLTDRRLLGPEGRIVPLGQVEEIKTFLGDVVLVMRNGDKHLLHYFADPALVVAAIANAQKGIR